MLFQSVKQKKEGVSSNIKFFLIYILLEALFYFTDTLLTFIQFPIEEFGYFRLAARELPFVILFVFIASNEILKRISIENKKSPLAELRSEIYRLVFRFFSIAILFVLTIHPILTSVLGAQFNTTASIANFYILLIIPNLLIPELILYSFGHFRMLFKAKIAQITLNILLSFWLCSLIGITGIPMGTLFSLLIGKLYCIFTVKKQLKISLNEYFPIKQYSIFSLVLLIVFIFVEFEII